MKVQRVAIIGAGVMGSAIAAHLANAGTDVDLLDVPAEQGPRDALAEQAIARLLKAEPKPLMLPGYAKRIRPGNLADHLHRLQDADWVIEAIVEQLEVKRELYRRLHAHCGPNTLISSNTSTLPLSLLMQDSSAEFRRRFMISHFFNPPRYMRLLECVPHPELDVGLQRRIEEFAATDLGKGCIRCHDTPGFIANRIGTYWLQIAFRAAERHLLAIEDCDAAMALFGVPKTGVFGLLDLVGLDLMPKILGGFSRMLPADDALTPLCRVPYRLQALLDAGYSGRKGQGGFYRLHHDAGGKHRQAVDLNSGEFRNVRKVRLKIGHSAAELRAFLCSDDALGRFSWEVWAHTLCYAAGRIPEIADTPEAIDAAMRLGYNWHYGPFELLDFLGADWFVARLAAEGFEIPDWLHNAAPVYRYGKHQAECRGPGYDYRPIVRPAGTLLLSDIKRGSRPLLGNASASVWDIGDEVACLELHSKMNTLAPDLLGLLPQLVSDLRGSFAGLVIYSDTDYFSAGANLALIAPALQAGDWEAIANIVRLGQNSFRALKYAPFPVVGAPSGLALGGGCEILLHCDALCAHAETYMGLVEAGVGLVPGWGGCKELLGRWLQFNKRPGGPMPAIAQTFELIATAKVSSSAAEAQSRLFLGRDDRIVMNRDRVLAQAKAMVLQCAPSYQAPTPYSYRLPGASGAAALDMQIRNLRKAGNISDYDVEIATRLARVLTGGDTDMNLELGEQDILDLELAAFDALVRQSGTQARLQHLLETGKPLRN